MLVVKDGKDKLVFVHLPKCAGTFVTKALLLMYPKSYRPLVYKDGSSPNHIPHYKVFNTKGKLASLRVLPSFGVIRNPWDYYVSLYYFTRERADAAWAAGTIYNRLGRPKTFEVYMRKLFSNTIIKEGEAEKPHVQSERMYKLNAGGLTVMYLDKFFKKGVFNNSIDYIGRNHKKLISIDRVIKCEDLHNELYDVLVSYNCKHKVLATKNKFIRFVKNKEIWRNPSKRGPYRELYTDDLKDMVREKDRLIIDKYGYEF